MSEQINYSKYPLWDTLSKSKVFFLRSLNYICSENKFVRKQWIYTYNEKLQYTYGLIPLDQH